MKPIILILVTFATVGLSGCKTQEQQTRCENRVRDYTLRFGVPLAYDDLGAMMAQHCGQLGENPPRNSIIQNGLQTIFESTDSKTQELLLDLYAEEVEIQFEN